ncbi:uncharacterized protein LOC142785628 [Rhipicephalus microplus]|uniref:uncharacterized protein LOC142785628 n=1 Tax=Rhipicephalus microplus TaxID=6941 RepID=UPI003F6ABB17
MDSSVRDQLESKVVYDRHVATYKWLASKFDIHTNTAKRYLKEFTNEQEADGSNVIGHSVITGIQDKIYRVILTARQSVSEAKNDLTTVTGVHAFSAQPSNLEDCIDRLTEAATSDFKLSVCPIYCEAAQRTRGARKGLNGISTVAERKAVSPAKPPSRAQDSKPVPTKSEPVKTEKDKPTPTSKGSAKSKPKQNNLATAFGKARTGAASASSKSTPTAEKDAGDSKVTPKGTPSSGEATKRKSVDKSPSDKSTPKNKRIKTEVPASLEVSSVTRKKPSRKHVISDSEDEEDEVTQSTTTPPSSENATSAVSSAATSVDDKPSAKSSPDSGTQGGQKKRRRVMKSVKKTFKDEEGFLVTKLVKELVSESDDDDDEDPLPKNLREKAAPEKPAGKKKAAASADKKQQSLLSFFGKK